MTFAVTLDDLATICKVTKQTVHGWIAAGMPIVEKGAVGKRKKTTVNLAACMRWYFSENYERLELDRARARLAHSQALASEMKNRLLSGDAITTATVTREFTSALLIFRTNGLGL